MALCTIRSRRQGMPKGLILPFAFGINTRRAGSGLYDPANSSARIAASSAWRFSSIWTFVDTVDARRLGSAGSQRNTSRLTKPGPVGDQPQETVELAFFVLR